MNLSGAKHSAKCQTPVLSSFGGFCLAMLGVLLFGLALLAIYAIGGDMAYAGALAAALPFIGYAIRKEGTR